MKRFIIMILCVSTFFIGLGGLVDKVGAKFKSDERALEIIKLARIAIGGDANINNVKSMTIVARATQNFDIDGIQKSEQGDLEINLQLPNKYSKMMKFINEDNANGGNIVKKDVKVIVMNSDDKAIVGENNPNGANGKVFVMKKDDADKMVLNEDNANGKVKKIIIDKDARVADGGIRQNELFRTTFALLLSAPEGLDVNYVYAGVGNVDGFSCDIIEAQSGGSSFKLYLDQSSHLPRMMSYQAVKPFNIKINKDENGNIGEKDTKVFVRQGLPNSETAEFQVKFLDYRSTGGIQLPYKWTQTVGALPDQNVDVVSFEINPANIADKFQNQKVYMKMKKPQ
ncbi:MAG: hypothetical protein ACR2MG_08010 [Pyrinomonadaceae bacterium]